MMSHFAVYVRTRALRRRIDIVSSPLVRNDDLFLSFSLWRANLCDFRKILTSRPRYHAASPSPSLPAECETRVTFRTKRERERVSLSPPLSPCFVFLIPMKIYVDAIYSCVYYLFYKRSYTAVQTPCALVDTRPI